MKGKKGKSLTRPLLLVAGAGDASDLRYGSGFMPVDPVVFLDAGPKRVLVVPLLELGRAQQEAAGVRVVSPSDLGLHKRKMRQLSAWAVELLNREGLRRVSVGPFFPAVVLEDLRAAGVKVHVQREPLYPARAVKDKQELRCLAESQRAAVAAMRAAVACLRASRIGRRGELRGERGKVLTAEDVRLVIDRVLLLHHCQARDTIVACGRQAADPHDRGHGPLRAHETIVLDIFPQHRGHGYWGDITRTVVRGTASPVARRMHEAVRLAQRWALRAVRAGVRGDRIHAAIQERFVAAGFPMERRNGVPVGFFHGTGHGVGLDIHEAPSLSLVEVRLRAGNVVTVEPGLYDPEHGGVRIEDVVVVTAQGCRELARCPPYFEL